MTLPAASILDLPPTSEAWDAIGEAVERLETDRAAGDIMELWRAARAENPEREEPRGTQRLAIVYRFDADGSLLWVTRRLVPVRHTSDVEGYMREMYPGHDVISAQVTRYQWVEQIFGHQVPMTISEPAVVVGMRRRG